MIEVFVDFKIFIELSDGWYSIRALCDCHLTDHFKSNKVKVGDKLAVFSAELVGCPNDGCTPLEVSDILLISKGF